MIRLILLVLCLALYACGDQETAPVRDAEGEGGRRAQAVVLFTIDTLRADRIRMYRREAPPSPATERLASESLVFDRAYSQASNTSPSVASILTGLLPPRHGVIHQAAKMSDDVISLPVMLQVAGVRTGSFVANLCKLQDVKPSVFNEGWEMRFCGMDSSKPQREWDQAVVDAGIEFIREAHAAGEPYFAWIHLMDPHSEYSPSPEDWDYDANPVREKIPQVRFLSGFEETLKSPPGPVLARLNNLYNAEVIGADRQLGRLLDFLDDMPGGEEVAVIFSSDHGEELYETWHRIGHGFSMTEGVLHVPLAIRAPGIEPGRSAALVETLSITPTILGLLGLEAPYPLDGGSLLSPRPGRTAARSFESGVAMTLRTAEHRFWRRTVQNAPTREWAPWRLQAPWFEQPDCLASYDGPWQNMPRWIDVTDPQHELLVGNLRNEARQILASINESVIENIDDEAFLEQLRELGYLGDDEG